MTSDMRDLIFKPTVISSGSDNTSGKISQRQIRITIRTGTMHVKSISIVPRTFASYLDTTLNPGVPYVPQYPGSPATKKYVDDKVLGAVSRGSAAPSSPVEGQLWYDTANDILKSYNGTTWMEVGEGVKNNTTGTTYNLQEEWVGDESQFNQLSNFGNIIYNVIE